MWTTPGSVCAANADGSTAKQLSFIHGDVMRQITAQDFISYRDTLVMMMHINGHAYIRHRPKYANDVVSCMFHGVNISEQICADIAQKVNDLHDKHAIVGFTRYGSLAIFYFYTERTYFATRSVRPNIRLCHSGKPSASSKKSCVRLELVR